jgi:carboxypeptidase C (cathepsin A)
MRNRISILVWLASGLLMTAAGAAADVPQEKTDNVSPAIHEFVSRHKIAIGKEVLNYTAVAGEITLTDREGAPAATLFSISYFKDGVTDAATRPITFLFNGGPGSSAIWLHLGAFGPKRLNLSSDPTNPGGPPYELRDNPHTLLRYSDLVFVDPVGTGYSRAFGKAKGADYWGVDGDSASIAQFIRLFLTKNNRWNSPKYLAGESYGTIRASLLVRDLELKVLDSVTLNGVILLSTALDVRTFISAGPANELPFITNLPTYAATAAYHNALPERPQDPDSFLKEARAFAGTEYLTALFMGDALPENQGKEIAKKLRYFTGLSEDYLIRSHLRVDGGRFLKELLRGRGQTLAEHDTRFLGKDPDEAGESVLFDPFLYGISGAFVAAFNSYLAALDVKMDSPYISFSLEANEGWKKGGGFWAEGFLYTADYLAAAAATNKDFRVFVASGLHDLSTSFFGTEYVFSHSGIPKDRIMLRNYFGGHMMYLYEPSLEQMSADIGSFIRGK